MSETDKRRILREVEKLTNLTLLRQRKGALSDKSLGELRQIITEERDESQLRTIPH